MVIYHDRASRTEPKSGGYTMPVSAVTNKEKKNEYSYKQQTEKNGIVIQTIHHIHAPYTHIPHCKANATTKCTYIQYLVLSTASPASGRSPHTRYTAS